MAVKGMKIFRHITLVYMVLVDIFVKHGVCFSSTSAQFQKQASGRYIGTPISTVTARSEMQCFYKCLKSVDVKCDYANFNAQDMTCELFQTAQSSDTGEPGWSRVDVSGGSCDGGWFEFGNKRYLAVNQTASWESSKIYCQDCGGTLASLHTSGIFDYVKDWFLAHRSDFTPAIWIGGYDYFGNNTGFKWMDQSPVNLSYKWKPLELYGTLEERCMALCRHGSLCVFETRDCQNPYNSLCERDMV